MTKWLVLFGVLVKISSGQSDFMPDYMLNMHAGLTVPIEINGHEAQTGLHGGGVFLFKYNEFLGVGGKGVINIFSFDDIIDTTGLTLSQLLNFTQLGPVLRLKTPERKEGNYSYLDFSAGLYQETLIRNPRLTFLSSGKGRGSTSILSYTDFGLQVTGGMLINHLVLQSSLDYVYGNKGHAFWINFSAGIGL